MLVRNVIADGIRRVGFVIRTLDPPLHEFVPKREELMVDIAKLPAADNKEKKEMAARYANFGAEPKNLKTVLPDLLKRVEWLHQSSVRTI